ncbi:hypothetical protein bcgnr5369_56890 [Bacillus cereus]|uniref:hypothetical protein n=1 Tax=Bacillus cereus group TaxID=86661 RepID=UPI001483208A|nr:MULTISPECIES: hypothetical protein [Bacillus cereus group]
MAMTREEKINLLHKTYGKNNEFSWSIEELNKRNQAQIDMLYNACLDENSKLITDEEK